MSNNTSSETHHMSYGTYIMVWLGLVALTAITVSVAGLNFGSITLTVALLIATAKTFLVMNYFMHVKFEHTVFKIFIAVCIITFIIMITLTFFDLSFR
ncbi:MAG: cytochrome-c oxidase [Ignavibacteriae bacterium]|nr:MAG: cytochrome-c oxidase [Ignavibacteriota bacterium]